MTDAQSREFAVVMGARQLVVVLFMAVVLMGTFTALAYVAGRVVLPIQAASVQHVPEEVLVVNAATDKEVRSSQPEPSRAAEVAARPAPPAPALFREPELGQLFFQVAAADRGVAEVFAEYLMRKQLSIQVATGPDERSYRVLVGPIRDNEHLGELRDVLEESGFRPFLRRY